jgi:hypothetical protein
MRRFIPVLILVVPLWAQLYLIDQPMPWSLMHGEYFINARLQNEGGMIAHVAFGLFDRITVGASYGGNSFIGGAKPTFFPNIGFQARVAIAIEDEFFLPDITVGFDNQGYGDYDNEHDQYQVRQKDFYCSIGKTFDWTNTYFLIGPNYWIMSNDRKGLSAFVAVKQTISENWNLVLEYDPNFGDRYDRNRGFLNIGILWMINENMEFSFALKDIFSNRPTVNDKDEGMNRILNFSFRQFF